MLKFSAFVTGIGLAAAMAIPSQALGNALFKAYSVEAEFEDVFLDTQDAIINRGYKIEYTGDIGGMLKRTGGDVGSTKVLYENAKFMLFCSARLSRATMEADVNNINFCPYIISVYEPIETKGMVYVSYRKLSNDASDTPHESLSAVENVLDAIAREATE